MKIYRVFILIGAGFLQSCAALSNDFEKATFAGRLSFTPKADLQAGVFLPKGRARLIMAIPNYLCTPGAPQQVIEVSIQGPSNSAPSTLVKMSALTWAHGLGSCDAYGYSKQEHDLRALEIDIPRDGTLIRLNAVPIGTPSGLREVNFWFVYGDRVPGNRIFSTPQ